MTVLSDIKFRTQTQEISFSFQPPNTYPILLYVEGTCSSWHAVGLNLEEHGWKVNFYMYELGLHVCKLVFENYKATCVFLVI